MTIDLDPIEVAYLIEKCGGPLDMSTRDLGRGMTGEKLIALRQKLQGPVRPYNPSTAEI